MLTVVLKPLFHRQAENIALIYSPDKVADIAIRKLKGIRWSQTNRCWYVPFNKESYQLLKQSLKDIAAIDSTAVKNYLQKKGRVNETLPVQTKEDSKYTLQPAVWNLNSNNLLALQKFVEQLKLKAYSPSTIRTYRNEFLQLLKILKNKNVSDLNADDIRRYMVYAMEKEGIRENTAHSRLNALKFYFEQVLNREKFFWEIPRPKKPQLLPKVLAEDELERLFNSLRNIKHKAMLFTAYSAGLRVSEVAALKIKHIDSGRMQIFIEQAKGKKDRYVNLSPVLLDILRAYIKKYNPKPAIYLFESEQTGAAYPTRTIQRVFQIAKIKAGIRKEIGVHSLRHSFATHLLEKGTDIKYIKDILGHFDIRTTERYLHITKKSLVNIISPLDDLWKRGKIDW